MFHVRKTPFGQALFDLLYTDFFSDFDKILALEQVEPLPFRIFQPILKLYFPRWDKNPSYMSEGPGADEVSLGELPLRIGQSLRFLYDFGDCWEISVALEDVDPEMEIEEPVLFDAKGEAPEQYPGWE
jgi:hypothetical protein